GAKKNFLPYCVDGLIKFLYEVRNKTGIKNIYFATDYPLVNSGRSLPQSSTFNTLYDEHHEAFKKLNSTFTINTWVSMKALDYLYELFPKYKKYIDEELGGSGIQGIADKLILIN